MKGSDAGTANLFRKLARINAAKIGLRVCPCCDAAAETHHEMAVGYHPPGYLVRCSGCGLRTPTIPTEQWDHVTGGFVSQDAALIATRIWNRRAS